MTPRRSDAHPSAPLVARDEAEGDVDGVRADDAADDLRAVAVVLGVVGGVDGAVAGLVVGAGRGATGCTATSAAASMTAPPLEEAAATRGASAVPAPVDGVTVGGLDLTYEAMEFPSDPGLTLLVYTAEPNTPTADALDLLASWAATVDKEQQADAAALPEGG